MNNIWGAYFEDDGTQLPISRAERLDTKHGVQGAVGRIAKDPTDPFQTICTGTLISPVHVLTRSICIQHVTPGNLYIIFPQEPGMAFQEDPSAPRQYLTSIPAGFDPEVAIFTLSEPVPKDIVRNYPRFNVERIEPIMRWVQDEANDHFFIAGMGWTFDQYGNLVQDYKRRYGDIRHLELETLLPPPVLLVEDDPNYANFFRGNGRDDGAPIFGRHPVTKEYIIVGMFRYVNTSSQPYKAVATFLGLAESITGIVADPPRAGCGGPPLRPHAHWNWPRSRSAVMGQPSRRLWVKS